MIENKEVAAEIEHKFRSCYQLLEDAILEVNKQCSEAEAKAFRQKVGTLFSGIVFDFLEPLYAAHPELKPPDWDD